MRSGACTLSDTKRDNTNEGPQLWQAACVDVATMCFTDMLIYQKVMPTQITLKTQRPWCPHKPRRENMVTYQK